MAEWYTDDPVPRAEIVQAVNSLIAYKLVEYNGQVRIMYVYSTMLGHVLRGDENTAVHQALSFAFRLQLNAKVIMCI